MATTGKVIGNQIGIYVDLDGNGRKLIAAGTGATFSADRQIIDVTTKDNNGARAILMGGKSVNFTFNGAISFDQSDATYNGYDALLEAWDDGSEVTVRFGTGEEGDKFIQCQAFIANISGDAPVNAMGTYTLDIQSTGDITVDDET